MSDFKKGFATGLATATAGYLAVTYGAGPLSSVFNTVTAGDAQLAVKAGGAVLGAVAVGGVVGWFQLKDAVDFFSKKTMGSALLYCALGAGIGGFAGYKVIDNALPPPAAAPAAP